MKRKIRVKIEVIDDLFYYGIRTWTARAMDADEAGLVCAMCRAGSRKLSRAGINAVVEAAGWEVVK